MDGFRGHAGGQLEEANCQVISAGATGPVDIRWRI